MEGSHSAHGQPPQIRQAIAERSPSLRYFLLDASALVSYYCGDEPGEIRARVAELFARHSEGAAFLYVPNFCVTEVLRSMAKKCWTEKKGDPDPDSAFHTFKETFLTDIRNAKILYSYELTRRHILLSDEIYKTAATMSTRQGHNPGAFDLLIIAMGLDLAQIHGQDNLYIVTADAGLADVCNKDTKSFPKAFNIAKSNLPKSLFVSREVSP